MKSKHLLQAVLLPALLTFLLPDAASAQQKEPVHYVIGIPSAVRSTDGLVCLKAAVEILLQKEPGGVVHIYDATTIEPLGKPVTIPSGNEKRRLRAVASAVKAWNTAVRKRFAENAPNLNAIRLPQLVDALARVPRPCRLLVVGDWRYRDARDAGFVWPDHYYPPDDHIAARRQHSLYGCADRSDQLDDVRVYFRIVGNESASDSVQGDGKRFWARFVNQQGGRLVLWDRSLDTAVGEFQTGSDVLAEKTLDLRLKGSLAMVPNEDYRVAVLDVPPKTRVIIVTDGSISSQQRLAIERAAYLRLLREWAATPSDVETGVVVFRGAGAHDIAPPTKLALNKRGAPDGPLMWLEKFISSKDVEVTAANFAKGSEVGTDTGKKMKVSRMEPLGSRVDIAFGLREGVRLLSRIRAKDRPVLVLCGDCDVSETYTGSAVAVENARLIAEVKALAQANPNLRVLSVYTGRKGGSGEALFKSVSAAAGKQGTYLDRADRLEGSLRMVVRDAQNHVAAK